MPEVSRAARRARGPGRAAAQSRSSPCAASGFFWYCLIRRNAALLEEVLRWVNTEKQRVDSTEQNVVMGETMGESMGESMGDLVAHYGLARRVLNFYNPQARRLVLHDSPQRGAYSPMGLQALMRQADFPVAFLLGNSNENSSFIRTTELTQCVSRSHFTQGRAVLKRSVGQCFGQSTPRDTAFLTLRDPA